MVYGGFAGLLLGPKGSAICAYSADPKPTFNRGIFEVFREDLVSESGDITENPFFTCFESGRDAPQVNNILSAESVAQLTDNPILVMDGIVFTQMVVDRVCVVMTTNSLNCQNQDVLFVGTDTGKVLKVVFVSSSSEEVTPVIAEEIYMTCLGSRDPYCLWNSRTSLCESSTLHLSAEGNRTGSVPSQLWQNIHSGSFLECIPDVNECLTGQHTCLSPEDCINTFGSFECLCPAGYTQNRDNSSCTDLNECATIQDICFLGLCINTEGSFLCDSRQLDGDIPGIASSNTGVIVGTVVGLWILVVITIGLVIVTCWLIRRYKFKKVPSGNYCERTTLQEDQDIVTTENKAYSSALATKGRVDVTNSAGYETIDRVYAAIDEANEEAKIYTNKRVAGMRISIKSSDTGVEVAPDHNPYELDDVENSADTDHSAYELAEDIESESYELDDLGTSVQANKNFADSSVGVSAEYVSRNGDAAIKDSEMNATKEGGTAKISSDEDLAQNDDYVSMNGDEPTFPDKEIAVEIIIENAA